METIDTLAFDDTAAAAALARMGPNELDALDFGVIGFDQSGVVRRYNRHESEAAGLRPERVIGHPLFSDVAPCMNNFMVAQRFADAAASGQPLDVTIDYVLTLRMRPTRVKLRLVSVPGAETSYVLLRRAS